MLTFREQLARHLLQFPERKEALARLDEFLRFAALPTARANAEGHVVASGIVTDGPRVLLIHHRTLQRWLQPGGHLEDGESPWAGAEREVREETGLSPTLDNWHVRECVPVDIDIHRIPANPRKGEGEHWHFDFRYVLRAETSGIPEIQPEEVTAVAWSPWSEAVTLVPSLGRVRAHARRLGMLSL